MSKPCTKFLDELFNVIFTIQGKANFMNLSRFSSLNEKTFRRWYCRSVHFLGINMGLIQRLPAGKYIAAVDCVVHTKSGKKTYGIGAFWSTIQHRSIRGLEVSCIALVHLGLNQGFSVSSRQTNGKSKVKGNRMDQYISQFRSMASTLSQYTRYVVGDGFYAKAKFVNRVLSDGFHLVSKLRSDADMRYLYDGKQKRKNGRKKRFDGKFDLERLDKLVFVKRENDYRIYESLVYNMTLKRVIKIVVIVDSKNGKNMIFSTDSQLPAQEIILYYRSRFQIELIFRDAKQHTGFSHSQSRNQKALNFHYNMSLTAVNLAKIELLEKNQFNPETVISIDDYKRKRFNTYFIERIMSMLDIKLDLIVKRKEYKNLINYGALAA